MTRDHASKKWGKHVYCCFLRVFSARRVTYIPWPFRGHCSHCVHVPGLSQIFWINRNSFPSSGGWRIAIFSNLLELSCFERWLTTYKKSPSCGNARRIPTSYSEVSLFELSVTGPNFIQILQWTTAAIFQRLNNLLDEKQEKTILAKSRKLCNIDGQCQRADRSGWG